MQLEVTLLDVGLPPPTTLKTVDLSGRIDIPLLGKMKAAGLTCAQLETKIDDAYKNSGVLKFEGVSVRIIGLQPPELIVMSVLLVIPALCAFGNSWWSWRAKRRLRAGLCACCGYDLIPSPKPVIVILPDEQQQPTPPP